MLISCQQKHDLYLLYTFDRMEKKAGLCVLEIALKCPIKANLFHKSTTRNLARLSYLPNFMQIGPGARFLRGTPPKKKNIGPNKAQWRLFLLAKVSSYC